MGRCIISNGLGHSVTAGLCLGSHDRLPTDMKYTAGLSQASSHGNLSFICTNRLFSLSATFLLGLQLASLRRVILWRNDVCG